MENEEYKPLSDNTYDDVQSHLWHTMSVQQLSRQQIIMAERMQAASMLRHDSAPMVQAALRDGYTRLTTLIAGKLEEENANRRKKV